MNGRTITTRRVRHVCQADKCQQGHANCPVPQACEMADTTDVGHAGAENVPSSPLAGAVLTIVAALAATGRTMTDCLVFAALYLRNIFSFGWSHPHAVAATRMDMNLRQRRKQQRGAP